MKKSHLEILEQGPDAWNRWRKYYLNVEPDLTRVDFAGIDLQGFDFHNARLMSANFHSAKPLGIDRAYPPRANNPSKRKATRKKTALKASYIMSGVIEVWKDEFRANLQSLNFSGADMRGANLQGAFLGGANLSDVDLTDADLSWSDLTNVDFSRANLTNCHFEKAILHETVFNNAILDKALGLENCLHLGPSSLDQRTIFNCSTLLPEKFLRGCGLPPILIDYLPSLLENPIQFLSCFVSYSHADEEFCEKLYSDLRNNNINCWYAPHAMKIGERIRPAIDSAIFLYEKLLLVLSENSINSTWVEKEVETAFEKERKTGNTVLFPIMLDDSVLRTDKAWAADIRRTRHIGDFKGWTFHRDYTASLNRLLRDLSKTDSSIPVRDSNACA